MAHAEYKTEISVSVRNIIEFIMRSGDLTSGFMGSSRAVDGTRAHQKVQQNRKQENYQAEITLSHIIEFDNYKLKINGRADGIFQNEDGSYTIEEIKSTSKELVDIEEDYNSLHWGQAYFYAYFYALEHRLKKIAVQLTYFQLEIEEIKEFKRNITIEELESFFKGIIEKYIYWSEYTYNWAKERNMTISELNFPFASYRKGQRQLAVSVYKTIVDKRKLYLQAPTGIGKTISTIFPAIKALGEELSSKIFYLTAKTVTRQVVEENLLLLYREKLRFKSITLTAKEKICFQEETDCNPESCPYAAGHYDRVNKALEDILSKEDLISRQIVEEYARLHQVCPFEFSLDLTLWVDMLICDYNYVFDPRVSLKRFFADDGGDYLFLIDEAHNLVDRAREMYSAELSLADLIDLKENLSIDKKIANTGLQGRALDKLLTYLDKLIKLLKSYQEQLVEDESFVQQEEPLEYYSLLNGFIARAEELLIINQAKNLTRVNDNNTDKIIEKLLEQYFMVISFLRISEIFADNFVVYYQEQQEDFIIKMFCLDPQLQLQEILKKGRAAVFFSATLTPLVYHREILGGTQQDYLLDLESPFDSNNLCLLVVPTVSTKYREREKSYHNIADYLAVVARQKEGNYLAFFPSYAYMLSVYEIFQSKYPELATILQSRAMSESERDSYLKKFDEKKAILGFAVLGGIFSEGVDLTGDRLLGSIIVGVAHPQICLERDLIRDYFQKKVAAGYEFAYLYPGINKVLQAAGRTIRTETDRGLILLIGQRFSSYRYQQMLPAWWNQTKEIVKDEYEIKKELAQFWL